MKLEKKNTTFIWSGNQDKSKYHLVKWDVITWPVTKGSWGLNNMHFLSLALRARILWLEIVGDSLRTKVIHVKYFKKISPVQ